MATKTSLRFVMVALSWGSIFYFHAEAWAQNAGDHQLYRTIIEAQGNIVAAAKEGNDDKLMMIFVQAMRDLHAYKTRYDVSEGVAQSPCQRSYEELSFSSSLLSVYVQTNRHLTGPANRTKDGFDADRWWVNHREALTECERYLALAEALPTGRNA